MRARKNHAKKLKLTNDGTLSIFFLGSGAAFSKQLNQTNVLVIKGNDHVMIDCGCRAPIALDRLGVSLTDIRTFLITHSHSDHIGGLEEAMMLGRYVSKRKPRIIITAEYQEILWDQSLRGGAEFNEAYDGKGLTFNDLWEVLRPQPLAEYARDTREIEIGSINLKLVRTNHIPQQSESWEQSSYCVGVIIDDRIFFSGDTQFDPELLETYDRKFRFEAIFHDAQFWTGGIHASLKELGTLPRSLKRRMLLMHYADSWREHSDEVRSKGIKGFAREGYFYDFA